RMAKRILGEYPKAYQEMLEFIDRFPDLQETPAQFQERCGQIALKNFWNEQHPDQGPADGVRLVRQGTQLAGQQITPGIGHAGVRACSCAWSQAFSSAVRGGCNGLL